MDIAGNDNSYEKFERNIEWDLRSNFFKYKMYFFKFIFDGIYLVEMETLKCVE